METSAIGRTQFVLDALGEGMRGLAEDPPSAWEAAAHFYLVRAILADLEKFRRKRKEPVNLSARFVLGLSMDASVEVGNCEPERQRLGWIPENS